VGGVAGVGASLVLPAGGKLAEAGAAALAAGCVVIVVSAIVFRLDEDDMRPVLERVLTTVRPPPGTQDQ
jgi:hypothetical protein